jgi:hypothetical protein
MVWNGQNAHFHHNSLKVSTLPYSPLLAPTLTHFLPLLATSYAAFRPCQEESCIYLKKKCENWTRRGREFCRHQLWLLLNLTTTLWGSLLLCSNRMLPERSGAARPTAVGVSCRILSLFPIVALKVDSPASEPIA